MPDKDMSEGGDREPALAEPAELARTEVIAVFGPTASGKSAVAEATAARLETEVVSVDALQVYRGLPILTNQPTDATRLVAIRSPDEQMTVGEFAPLAHREIDALIAAHDVAVVTGGTGLYLRAALTDLDLPPAVDRATVERAERAVDLDAAAAHERLGELDPAAAAAVHRNDRQRLVRALALAESGGSLARAVDRLWSAETRRPTLVVGLVLRPEELDRRIRERAQRMLDEGVIDEVRRALGHPLSRTVEKALGLEEIAALPPDEALEALVRRTGRYARYQQKWMRRIPGIVLLDGARNPETIADDILAHAGRGHLMPGTIV
jgi:tRNA dimethylallyltransferase